MNYLNLDRLLTAAVENRIFPSAVAAVGDAGGVHFLRAYGYSRVFSDGEPCFDTHPAGIPPEAERADSDTPYDLASMTKLIATTMIALKLIESGRLQLGDKLSDILGGIQPDKTGITVFQLLTHTSGLPSHFHLSVYMTGGDISIQNAARLILSRPLSAPPGTKVIYSCMGYIVLGAVLETITGKDFAALYEEYVRAPLGLGEVCFNLPPLTAVRAAATEFDQAAGCYSRGAVHDENALFLGGISPNAGLFGRAEGLIRFARMLAGRGTLDGLRYLDGELFDYAASAHTREIGEPRGLGFDLRNFNIRTSADIAGGDADDLWYGHTGFTGTSLFVNRNTGIFGLLLTNRVHYTRKNTDVVGFRKVFYNAICD